MKRIQSDSQSNRTLLNWLNTTLNCQQSQVEQLGNGLAYCLLMHHFFPVLVPLKKICLMPRRQSDNINNLRFLVEVLNTLKWRHIIFDINKVSSYSYQDNIQLLAKLQLALMKSEAIGSKNNSEVHEGKSTNNLHKKVQYPPTNKNNTSTTNFPVNHQSKVNFNQRQHHLQLIHLGIATPLKHYQKIQPSVLDQIKSIVSSSEKTDRQKVTILKNLLGIQVEERKNYQQQCEKDLLSDQNKKQSMIVIDQP